MNPESALPDDHSERMSRVRDCLEGLSVGDGFGDCFFGSLSIAERRIQDRSHPPAPWFVTDDSIMGRNVARSLQLFGQINQDWLAQAFADAYDSDPRRGYGGTAHGILRAIAEGVPWQEAAGRVFDGSGSCGNGGAMRAGPVGAYFAGMPDRIVMEARASAEVTHAHEEGQAGAIAVALAAGWMAENAKSATNSGRDMIEYVLRHMPAGETARLIRKALTLPFECSPVTPASILGSGYGVIAQDTVPFCLWCAARHPSNYQDALWTTIQGLGDCDTTCAIVGSIVAAGGTATIPVEWINSREPLGL